MKKNLYSINRLAIGITVMVLAIVPGSSWAKVIVVHPGDVIQKAVDSADPGDIIHIKPGVYTGAPGKEAVFTVKKSGITIRGSTDALIDASGFKYGILVGEDAELTAEGCPPVTVKNFNIQGLTIRNADDTALKLVGVDGFSITRGVYLDNKEYGPFPVCSQNGQIAKNFASGHGDAAIYVGNDDHVAVRNNTATHSLIGVEIENSADCIVRDNHVSGNTGGILVVALPGLPKPFTKNVLIRNNEIVENNYPISESEIDLLPVGTGILNLGSDNVTIRNNKIIGNDTVGVALIGNPLVFSDPRLEPFVDGNSVRNNTIRDNGSAPDPNQPLFPAADIVFLPDVVDTATGLVVLPDPDPTDNCFKNNRFSTDFPAGIVDSLVCP